MGVGARDQLDQKLVKKYSNEKMNNLNDAETKIISSDKYWEIMKEVSEVHQAMLKVSSYIKNKKDAVNQKFLAKGV